MDVEAFWLRLNYLCRKNGMNVTGLQEKIGLSKSYLHVIKSRDTLPSIEVLIRISDTLDVSLDYLIRGEKATSNSDVNLVISRMLDDPVFKIAVLRLSNNPKLAKLVAEL